DRAAGGRPELASSLTPSRVLSYKAAAFRNSVVICLRRRWGMTTVMVPQCWRRLLTGALTALTVLVGTRTVLALTMDERGEIRLGLRGYTAVRVGTERIGDSDNPLNYPVSGAGHLRQNRYFLQLSYDHDLTRLAKQSYGLLAPFRLLNPTALKYTLEYRFE